MENKDEAKKLLHELISSYEATVSRIGEIMDNVYRNLEEFRAERNEISRRLKETLAGSESLRRKDFDDMVKGVFEEQDEKLRQVKGFLSAYLDEQKDMARTLRNALSEENSTGNIKNLLRDIHIAQKEKEEKINRVLSSLQEDYEAMASPMRGILNKGEGSRLELFKETLRSVHVRQKQQADLMRKEMKKILHGALDR